MRAWTWLTQTGPKELSVAASFGPLIALGGFLAMAPNADETWWRYTCSAGAVVAALLATWYLARAGFAWTALLPAGAGIGAAFALWQVTVPGGDDPDLVPLELVVATGILAWLLAMSAWLIWRMLTKYASTPTRTHARRLTAVAFVASGIIPGILVWGLPRINVTSIVPWLLIVVVAPAACLLAVVPRWFRWCVPLLVVALVLLAGVLTHDHWRTCIEVVAVILGALAGSFGVEYLVRAELGRRRAQPSTTKPNVDHGKLERITRSAFAACALLAAGAALTTAIAYETPRDVRFTTSAATPVVLESSAERDLSPTFVVEPINQDVRPSSVCEYVKGNEDTGPTSHACLINPKHGNGHSKIVHEAPPPYVYAVKRTFTTPDTSTIYAFARDTDEAIEYWIFYTDDHWSSGSAFGSIVQQHEADWEVVTVGLANHVPVWVAYSGHCSGSVLPWSAVPRAEGVHPLVFVAKGSHANYPSRHHRNPDWASCPIPEASPPSRSRRSLLASTRRCQRRTQRE